MRDLIETFESIKLIQKESELCFTTQCFESGATTGKHKIYNSILELVGNTPLIKLNKIPQDHNLNCEIYAKCEFFNPSGSIKDRIALSMIQDAKKAGVVNKHTNFVEPTSGNTGIGIALNATLMGNGCQIVTHYKNSGEKVNTLKLLGAEVIQIKANEDEIAITHQLRDANQHGLVLNQFKNEVNPRTHYEITAVEILSALNGLPIDMITMGAGTGGTMTGIGSKIKETYPECKVVAAEPEGSIMINTHGKKHDFLVEGIGGGWTPAVFDKCVVDHLEVVSDEESFLMARELAKKEGLLCGGSGGTIVAAAIKAAQRLKLGAGKRIVVMLPDGIRNYMSKFVTEQWMEAHLFMDPPEHTMSWWKEPYTRLQGCHEYPKINHNSTCADAVMVMDTENIAIVVDDKGWFVGAISKDSIRHVATNPMRLPKYDCEELNFKDSVTHFLVKDCYTLAKNGKKGIPTLGLVSRVLDITPFVVIGKNGHDPASGKDYFLPEAIFTGNDVTEYIFAHQHSCCWKH